MALATFVACRHGSSGHGVPSMVKKCTLASRTDQVRTMAHIKAANSLHGADKQSAATLDARVAAVQWPRGRQ
jgi:hypothetical protein